MWIVKLALKRPYTFVVLAILIFIFGVHIVRTPRIFSEYRHPRGQHYLEL
jgi:hypothetical protein